MTFKLYTYRPKQHATHIKADITVTNGSYKLDVEVVEEDCVSIFDPVVGVEVCKHSFIMLQAGGLGGGNNVDGVDNTLTFGLESSKLGFLCPSVQLLYQLVQTL